MGSIQADFESAPVKCRPMVAEDGHLVLVPDMVADWFRAHGGGWLKIRMPGGPGGNGKGWLTLTEAAAKYLEDRPDFTGIESARKSIIRACDKGEIEHRGMGRATRIHPISFDAWRLKKQKEYLDQDWENDK